LHDKNFALHKRVKVLEKVAEAADKYEGNGRHAEWCYKQGIGCACGKEGLRAALEAKEG
jgi:hypothetical protein